MSTSTGAGAEPVATEGAVVLDAPTIDRLPSQQLHGLADVLTRVLWRSRGSLAGVMEVAPGEQLASHRHLDGHHHVWIISGTARILGQVVGPGSYVHIPAGMEHAVESISPEGLKMFYLYLQVS